MNRRRTKFDEDFPFVVLIGIGIALIFFIARSVGNQF
jgi:hypothetical protein